MLAIQAAEGEGSGHPSKPQPQIFLLLTTNKNQSPIEPIPKVLDEAVYEEWDDKVERATTIAASLDAEQASGNINRTQSTAIPNVPLPQGIGAGVESLDADLQQTKKVYGAAYTKLIKKVKKLEKTVKSNQLEMSNIVVQHDAEIQGRHRQEIEFETEVYIVEDVSIVGAVLTTIGASISTTSPPRVSTAEDISIAETLVHIRRSTTKDKGKDKMDESDPEKTKTKLLQRQERACYEAAVRLQEQLDEEERKRIARVHEEASSLNIEEWEDIQATIEADEELA
ncbi:hypothetical protein Tco_0345205 [Tanacetum coccineum]